MKMTISQREIAVMIAKYFMEQYDFCANVHSVEFELSLPEKRISAEIHFDLKEINPNDIKTDKSA